MEYICIGRIINTHGIRGELKLDSYSDFDEKRYRTGNTVFIESDESLIPFEVATFRRHKGFPLVSLKGYRDINAVEQYVGCLVYVDSDSREKLKRGEYYRSELIGCIAIKENGEEIGEVIGVEETNGAQNNLRILTKDEKEILIPYVKAFIPSVELNEKRITVRWIEGIV